MSRIVRKNFTVSDLILHSLLASRFLILMSKVGKQVMNENSVKEMKG